MIAREVAAIVLAAGASARMGAPKALVQWRGRSFVGHVVDRAASAGCAPIIVVQGAHAIDAADVAPATIHVNAAWAEGPMTSLQVGLSAIGDASAVVIATVDRPHVSEKTWRALLAAHAGCPDVVWQPRFGTKRGHPIVLPAWLVPRARALAPTETLHDLLAAPDIARDVVDVDDAAVLDNLDSPADLARLPP